MTSPAHWLSPERERASPERVGACCARCGIGLDAKLRLVDDGINGQGPAVRVECGE